jgi:hypothetical protein
METVKLLILILRNWCSTFWRARSKNFDCCFVIYLYSYHFPSQAQTI